MTEQSYEFTGLEKVNIHGYTVRQIRATRDIPRHGIRKGDLGGWIESSELTNGNARVSGDAWVSGNAQVYGNAQVSGNARVYGNAWVSGDAWVYGNARVYGNAQVYGDAQVYGNAWVFGDAQVYGNARVYGNAWVSGDARVSGNAQVYGDARVSGNARVSGDAWVSGDAQVYGNARVYGDAWVSGNAQVYGNAQVEKTWHYIAVGPIGSEGVVATVFRTENGKHILAVGCWTGTLGTLMAEVKRRRESWRADELTQDLWMEQYRALKRLGNATVARWAEVSK